MINLSFLPVLDTESLKNINLIIGCFFFSFTGSYIQEIANIYKGKQRSTKIHKVVIGTIIGMGFYLLLVSKFIRNVNISLSVTLNVISGLLGYELFNRTSSIENIKQTTSDINEIFRNLFNIGVSLGKLLGNHDKSNEEK